MLFQPNTSNKNNVLMTAAIYSSEKSLKLLLHLASTWRCFREEASLDMDIILHAKNEYGNTLLSLVLQHRDALEIPKHILLGFETEFHHGNDLEKCFHKRLIPSEEVLEVLKQIQKTRPKSKINVAVTWMKTFFFSFLIPSTMIALDMAFDILLVHHYSEMDQDCLTAQWQVCRGQNVTETCGEETTDIPDYMEENKYLCIPLKLDLTPRFYYSLGFVLWPWLYYVTEFCQSTIGKSIHEVLYLIL